MKKLAHFLLILSASSLPDDLHLLLDDFQFAGDIRTLAGGRQEREAGERSHGIGQLERDETHRRQEGVSGVEKK
jgi:hypothetical protein